MKTQEQKFEVLTGRDQILKRPQMWIGSMDNVDQYTYTIRENNIEYEKISYIPAFKKIIDEILDNSLDALIEKNNCEGTISITIDNEKISIQDNGKGIPVVKKLLTENEKASLPKAEAEELSNMYIPQIAWTRLFSGSNFTNDSTKTTIGSHGIGSKATAIFSTKFIGTTDDGNKKCIVTSTNNLEKSNCQILKSTKKSGTKVEFWPDISKFKMQEIEKVYSDILFQRVLCLSMIFRKIKFIFNGKSISINDSKFLKMFSEDINIVTFKNGFIGICHNPDDDFRFFSYVNGLHMTRGGSHIDYIANTIVTPIREKLAKKYKMIKPADIKNKLTLIVFLRNFPNPKFDSQTKETLTNSQSEINTFLKESDINFDNLSKLILKNDSIIKPIIDLFQAKEDLKAKSELKKSKKSKIKSDKYMPPIGEKKWLALCEGASAVSGISSSLGRNGFGYYAMRGLPLNSYSSSLQKIASNQEMKEITQILNLDLSSKNENKKIEFDKILITSDNDCIEEDSEIITLNGPKKIKDITYQDKVLSSDNKYHNINYICKKETNEYILVRFGKNVIKMSPNHKLIVSRDNEIQQIYARDIRKTDKLLYKK